MIESLVYRHRQPLEPLRFKRPEGPMEEDQEPLVVEGQRVQLYVTPFQRVIVRVVPA